MTRVDIIKCTCGPVAAIVVLGLYSYYARELLVSLALFTVVFLMLTLATFAAVFLWWAGEELTRWSGPTSRKFFAFSRRFIAAFARS